MDTSNQPERIITDTVIKAIMNIGYEKEISLSQLSRNIDITYTHVQKKIVPKLLVWGIVKDEWKGRERVLTLTPRGFQIFKRLQEIGELLDEKQKQWVKQNLKKETIFLLKLEQER